MNQKSAVRAGSRLETNPGPGLVRRLSESHVMARGGEKIGLLHHIGGGNLGDDATQAAVLQNIRTRWPRAQLFGFSANPADTQQRHGIPSYPIRRQTWGLGYAVGKSEATFKDKTKGLLSQYPALFQIVESGKPCPDQNAQRALSRDRFPGPTRFKRSSHLTF